MSHQNPTIKTEEDCYNLLLSESSDLSPQKQSLKEKIPVKIEEDIIDWSKQEPVGTVEPRLEIQPVIVTVQDQEYKDYLNNLVLEAAQDFIL